MVKTNIICSIGPSSWNPDKIEALAAAGMSIARLNFSHDNHEGHLARIMTLRQHAPHTPLMLDTKGPELRTGMVENDEIFLEEGKEIRVTTEDIVGTPQRIQIRYPKLVETLEVGDSILIADGKMEFEVIGKEDGDVLCLVVVGGVLENTKNVNLPNKDIDLPALAEKDIRDIKFGVEHGVNYIAASFVRCKEDILQIQNLIGNADIKIIAKIEHTEALRNIDEIIATADGIMVARGDLGMQIDQEDLPLVQKMIVQKCNDANKFCIVATQMLDSMISNPRPTRAEIMDVANAVLDGAQGVMLSGETAKGKYPIKAVETMRAICQKIEESELVIKPMVEMVA